MNKVINIFVLGYIDACVFVNCIVFICIFHVFAYCVVCEYAGCMQGACYSSVKEIGLDIQNIVTSYIVLVLNFRNCCNTCIGVLTSLFCTCFICDRCVFCSCSEQFVCVLLPVDVI